jgi:hypothetical protein
MLALAAITARTASARPRRPCSTRRGAFDGDVVEVQLAHDTDKKRRRRDDVVRRHLSKGDKNTIRSIITVRPIGPKACV